uniref:Uncharacterized protein n=1 Tax=Anguilla anguilla TaxID=7936 RepID=A0A0E9R1Y0_ANGAN
MSYIVLILPFQYSSGSKDGWLSLITLSL